MYKYKTLDVTWGHSLWDNRLPSVLCKVFYLWETTMDVSCIALIVYKKKDQRNQQGWHHFPRQYRADKGFIFYI